MSVFSNVRFIIMWPFDLEMNAVFVNLLIWNLCRWAVSLVYSWLAVSEPCLVVGCYCWYGAMELHGVSEGHITAVYTNRSHLVYPLQTSFARNTFMSWYSFELAEQTTRNRFLCLVKERHMFQQPVSNSFSNLSLSHSLFIFYTYSLYLSLSLSLSLSIPLSP